MLIYTYIDAYKYIVSYRFVQIKSYSGHSQLHTIAVYPIPPQSPFLKQYQLHHKAQVCRHQALPCNYCLANARYQITEQIWAQLYLLFYTLLCIHNTKWSLAPRSTLPIYYKVFSLYAVTLFGHAREMAPHRISRFCYPLPQAVYQNIS